MDNRIRNVVIILSGATCHAPTYRQFILGDPSERRDILHGCTSRQTQVSAYDATRHVDDFADDSQYPIPHGLSIAARFRP